MPLGRGITMGARGVTTDDEREQVGCFHFVNEGKNTGRGDCGRAVFDPESSTPSLRPQVFRPKSSLERGVAAELRRSDDQLMMTHRMPREATTTIRLVAIAFIAHRIV
jgi:hypothetical protein